MAADLTAAAVPSAPPGDPRLFGFRFSPLSRGELADQLAATPVPPGGGLRLVVTMNLDHVVRLRRSAPFRAAYRRAWATTADGAPVCLYARLKGVRLPRVTGSDLLADLLVRLDPKRRRPFFVVSSEATAAGLRRLLIGRGFPPEALGFAIPPFGFERDVAQSTALAEAIAAHRTTDLVFGLGAPKSEVWLDAHRAVLGDLYAYPFGSGPDFLVGAARRAPDWMQRAGMEWLWRVAGDPKRLFRRYFVDSWTVLPAVWDDLRGRGLGA